MAKYNITLDDKIIETVDSYKEDCDIAEELDKHPANYLKIVDIVKCENYEQVCEEDINYYLENLI